MPVTSLASFPVYFIAFSQRPYWAWLARPQPRVGVPLIPLGPQQAPRRPPFQRLVSRPALPQPHGRTQLDDATLHYILVVSPQFPA